jgi:hypothetical protein
VKRDDPVADRRRALMRQAAAATTNKFSLSGREKEGKHKPRRPSMPKTPWDDKPADDLGGLMPRKPSKGDPDGR